jgi:hypothetical protein
MARKRTDRESDRAILLGVKREMAKPRMAQSARENEVTPASPRIMKRKRGNAKP